MRSIELRGGVITSLLHYCTISESSYNISETAIHEIHRGERAVQHSHCILISRIHAPPFPCHTKKKMVEKRYWSSLSFVMNCFVVLSGSIWKSNFLKVYKSNVEHEKSARAKVVSQEGLTLF
jgi:hypothetical protein